MLIGEGLQAGFQPLPGPFPAFGHHFGFNLRQRWHRFLRCLFHGALACVGLWLILCEEPYAHIIGELSRCTPHPKIFQKMLVNIFTIRQILRL